MLAKTRALVLGSVKYGDNSLIVKAYTKDEGIKSFIVGSIHSKKGVLKPAMVQALSQLDLVYYSKGKGELKRIKEAAMAHHYNELWFDPVKSSLAMFLAEILAHVLKEEETNPNLFDFISEAFMELDELEEGIGNFHLFFLLRLSGFLGFAPQMPLKGQEYFDLQSGIYSSSNVEHYHYLNKEESKLWLQMQEAEKANSLKMGIAKTSRSQLLEFMLNYYRLHITDFGQLRSLEVVKSLLS
ncbi:DNA repair protein RecO [Owenweeksia hongkongensis DSM 17368]|uniref:DNA repair protein RecO n=1 Tax=Owenweeksia hongkongensis (strain DSM 17368 / CIP 108786 / JCM 12287 / NRRL B-23963 / UST20020801) TaxID=926562 RepID=G8R757_OWEHD|nr:DNA repair protein RecO [Owenweeksia hongkongensis]AEV33422.1 DNA repair protein RecO [Owenweeksia hongkongensis DSM 17368]